MFRRAGLALLVIAAACGGKIDVDENVGVRTIGTDQGGSDGPGNVVDGGVLIITSPVGGCGVSTPIRVDFEGNAPLNDFTLSEPSAFTLDRSAPIDGAQSLEVKQDGAAFILRKEPSTCSGLVSFDLRISPEIAASGLMLVRVVAATHTFTLIADPGGAVHLDQDASGTAQAHQTGPQFATITAGAAVSIILTVDERDGAIAQVLPLAATEGVGDRQPLLQPGLDPLGITEVDIGPVAGGASGTYWLDDLAIQ